ncbi:unnamed protein product, partial [Ectocarpus fasciculatus]
VAQQSRAGRRGMAAIQEHEAGGLGVIRLEPIGIKLGATAGISSAYDDQYPPELEGWMATEEWFDCIGRINRALMDRFPCGLCRLQAYCFCPCTLGLSLLSMRKEAKEIERGVGEVIKTINQNLEARRRSVRFGFHRTFCSAWVQVEYGSKVGAPPPPLLPAAAAAAAAAAGDAAQGSSLAGSSTAAGGSGATALSREREAYSADEGAGGRKAAPTTVAATTSGAMQPLGEALLEPGNAEGEERGY